MQFIIFRKVLFLFTILSFFLLGSSCDFLSKKKDANVIDTNEPLTSTTDEESITSVTEEYPTDFPEQGNKMEDFVPKHWSAIMKVDGDLNKDGLTDTALIVEQENPNNISITEYNDTLNTNPRALLVLFKQENGTYKLAAKNDKGFIEPPKENSSLLDPLGEGDINIKNNTLRLKFQYFFSAGSWYITNVEYVFRYQNSHFELIGVETNSFHRATGEETIVSFNLSTNKLETNMGGNVFEEKENNPKKETETFIYNPKPILDNMEASAYLTILYNRDE
ncbi:hypothetical protein [Capnocytophaga gingivalis]|uniref:hypothetical protein n=1 Tax=Capnocytophaga gingivalis TaxID=1017 RepID=UPI002B4858AE|nr:hypothetical protein [Capnocytophaga gingivalis]MEB3013822.1 hypothetical protein [Capnocytophaga gingivalis]